MHNGSETALHTPKGLRILRSLRANSRELIRALIGTTTQWIAYCRGSARNPFSVEWEESQDSTRRPRFSNSQNIPSALANQQAQVRLCLESENVSKFTNPEVCQFCPTIDSGCRHPPTTETAHGG